MDRGGMACCPSCGSLDLVVNPSRGDTVCGTCGEVVEERNMVVDVGFGEGDTGAKYLQGRTFQITTAQERVTSRGIQEICKIASSLDLATNIQEPGRRILTLAVQKGFHMGRPTKLVASACLYLACRRSRSHHLLIDFSDHLRKPVKVVGGTYVKLMQRLLGNHARYPLDAGAPLMEVPVVDPSVFIDRFARKLWRAVCPHGHPMKHLMPVQDCTCSNCQLTVDSTSWMFSCRECNTLVCESCQRDRTSEMLLAPDICRTRKQVQNTAMRLIQFMHRDWICLGRRPNGLVGAALLIAAFYHKVGFSAGDISQVVRIGEGTLRTRLKELMSTTMASMSREDFERADPSVRQGDSKAMPPCMRQRAEVQDMRRALADLGRPQALEDKAKLALLDSPSSDAAGPETLVRMADAEATGGAGGAADDAASEHSTTLSDSVPGQAQSAPRIESSKPGAALTQADKFTAREPTAELIQEIAQDVARHHGIEGLLGNDGRAASGEDAASRMESLLAGRDADALSLAPSQKSGSGNPVDGSGPAGPGTPKSNPAAVVEESLSDIDDEELDLYLLDEEEQQHKAEIWHEVNKDYLEEWHLRSRDARRRKEQQEQRSQRASSDHGAVGADSASETGSARTGGSSRSGKRSRLPAASSCTQSAVMALTKKGKLNKNRINTENLMKLFDFD